MTAVCRRAAPPSQGACRRQGADRRRRFVKLLKRSANLLRRPASLRNHSANLHHASANLRNGFASLTGLAHGGGGVPPPAKYLRKFAAWFSQLAERVSKFAETFSKSAERFLLSAPRRRSFVKWNSDGVACLGFGQINRLSLAKPRKMGGRRGARAVGICSARSGAGKRERTLGATAYRDFFMGPTGHCLCSQVGSAKLFQHNKLRSKGAFAWATSFYGGPCGSSPSRSASTGKKGSSL